MFVVVKSLNKYLVKGSNPHDIETFEFIAEEAFKSMDVDNSGRVNVLKFLNAFLFRGNCLTNLVETFAYSFDEIEINGK